MMEERERKEERGIHEVSHGFSLSITTLINTYAGSTHLQVTEGS